MGCKTFFRRFPFFKLSSSSSSPATTTKQQTAIEVLAQFSIRRKTTTTETPITATSKKNDDTDAVLDIENNNHNHKNHNNNNNSNENNQNDDDVGEHSIRLIIARGSVVDFCDDYSNHDNDDMPSSKHNIDSGCKETATTRKKTSKKKKKRNTAIVNAANEECLGGGGIDGEISKAGGPQLYKDRLALPSNFMSVRCPTGNAVITGRPNNNNNNKKRYGKLMVNHVIHAVGPNYQNFSAAAATTTLADANNDDNNPNDGALNFEIPDRLLKSAYQSSLDRAKEANIYSIAFPLLSSGVFRGNRDKREILKIAITSIVEWVQETTAATTNNDPCELKNITICGHSEEEATMLVEICNAEPQLVLLGRKK